MPTLSALSSQPNSSKMKPTRPPPQPAGRLCEIRRTEKKGLGLYAKVDIAEGTVISEEISVKCDIGEYTSSAATWKDPEFWEDIRSYRVRPVEDAVSDLIALYKDDAFVKSVASQLSRSLSVPGLSDHANLFFTNCQPLEDKTPPFSIFFGLVTCAFNHSCIGNATFNECGTREGVHLVTDVVAIKPIKAGTEITVSYTILALPTAERRLSLRQIYGFECICELCMDVTPETTESFAKVIALMKEIEAPGGCESTKQKTPWLFFKSALELAVGYMKLGIKDMRCALLWENCAAVAAYHSDALRTHYCLLWAAEYWDTLGPDRAEELRRTSRPEEHQDWGNTTLGLSEMTDIELFQSRTQKDALLGRILMAGHEDESYDRIKPKEEDLAEKEKLAEQKRAELLAELDEEDEEKEKKKKKKKKEQAAVPIKKAKKKRSKKQNERKGAAGGAEKGSEETVVPAPPAQVVRLNVVEDREQMEASGAGWEEVGAKKRPH